MSLIDRRVFLTRTAAACAGYACVRAVPLHAWIQQAAAAGAVLDKGFASVTRIAEGVYATIADAGKGPQAFSNGGLIVGREAVLIIEGHHQPVGAQLEVEAARAVSKAPIRAAVNTHYHFDHTFGNSYYEQQKIPIIAHERVATMMKEQYAALKGKDQAPLLAPFEQKVAAAKTETEQQRAQSDLDLFKTILGSIDATTLAYPTKSVSSSEKIPLGGVTALLEVQPGHTPTDVTITVPEQDVVFAGDLLFNGLYPISFDANMTAWRKVLDNFAKRGSRTKFVPGHGAVGGIEIVRQQIDIMDDLRAHTQKMIKAGVAVSEAQHRYVVPERFKNVVVLAWGFSIGAAIEKYYAELAKA